MADNYVCIDHPDIVLTNVRGIRADIGRPSGVNVVGDCEECRKPRLHKGRGGAKMLARNVLSYGKRAALSEYGAKAE